MGHAIQPMPSPPGSGLKPAEPVDIAETDQTEEMVTALGEVPEDEVEEEGRVLQEEQDPAIELHPRAEEDKIPEEGGYRGTCVWNVEVVCMRGGGGECIIHKCKYLCTYFSTVGVCVCTYVCSDVLV